MTNDVAYLSNEGKYSFFRCGKYTFKFRTSERLVKYVAVKEWDDGYIVVDCLHEKLGVIEDYIDLAPMMDNLFLNADEIFTPIRKVEIEDDESRKAS